MSDDAGAEASSNFRFQSLYAALLAMQMYNGKNDLTEVICEINNDITTKDRQGYLVSYQLTRTDDTNSIPRKKILKSIKDFLKFCNDKKYKALCLLSNQRIGNIATKTNKMSYLSEQQMKEFASELGLGSVDVKCFNKMGFMVIQDFLTLEYLVLKEIVQAHQDKPQPQLECIKCIMQEVIKLAQKCSRTSEKEDALSYTSILREDQENLKIKNRTIRTSDIVNIVKSCSMSSKIEMEKEEFTRDNLKENDDKLVSQLIHEASDEDDKIAFTALIFLERLGSEMKIHNSIPLRRFLKRSLHDEDKVSYLNNYLDLVKRMLNTSMIIERNYEFHDYVKKYFKKRIIEIIISFDDRFVKSKSDALQIVDNYGIVSNDERTKIYIETLLRCVEICNKNQYKINLNYLIDRIPKDISNKALKRGRLIKIRIGNPAAIIMNRCDDLLGYYM
jgi:hypothetical protein